MSEEQSSVRVPGSQSFILLERGHQSFRTGLKTGEQLREGGKKNPNKWQDGFSSLLQVCAIIWGEILVVSFLSRPWEGIFPPQILSLQRVLPELPQGGEKCFGFGCAARRAPALATLEGKITIVAGAGSSPARAALPKGILMGGRWHRCQLPAMGTAQLGAAGAAGWVWGGSLGHGALGCWGN